MSETITRREVLVTHSCPTCGVLHAYPEALDEKALEHRGPNGRSVCCPNGHRWHYTGKSDADKQRERADANDRRAELLLQRVKRTEDERDRIERQRRATKGALTRTKRRLAAGICPCCTQKFDNLADHMTERHPDYVEE